MKIRILILWTVLLTCFPVLYGQSDFIIIVNKNVVEEAIDQPTIKSIYLGKKSQWKDGSKIIPVTLSQGETHECFMETVIKKSATAYVNYWRKMIFTGKGIPPVSFHSDHEVLEYVNTTEGAIGYISKGESTLSEYENVVIKDLPL